VWHIVALLVSTRLIVERELAEVPARDTSGRKKRQLQVARADAIGTL